jgi:site-specific DNA-adenine methylase
MSALDYTLFPYSGKKVRVLDKLGISEKHSSFRRACRVVEPFAGSLSFSALLHTYRIHKQSSIDILGYETSVELCSVYDTLRDITESRLRYLNTLVCSNIGLDLRSLSEDISLGEQSLIRLLSCGVYRGTLRSWKITSVLKARGSDTNLLQVDRILRNRHWLASLTLKNENGSKYLGEQKDGDIVFLDPPYISTNAGYSGSVGGCISESDIAAIRQTNVILKKCKQPTIFTYGDGAPEYWPHLDWKVAETRKVPILRGGGTRLRTEYVALINWEK